MALTPVPLLRENSILCWEKEAVFKEAAATTPWKSLGRVEDWTDMGPTQSIFREAIAGSGREAATIGSSGTSYGPYTLGPYQIVDPLHLGFAWGQEPQPPVQIGATPYYRHTAIPTTRGAHPSFSLQMADYDQGAAVDGLTFLGVVMTKLGLRGEETGEDGSGGRIMAAPTIVAHDDADFDTVPAKPVFLPSSTPYFKQAASIKFYNGDLDWRIHAWDFMMDSHSGTNWYHQSNPDGKPTETPPQGVLYDLGLDIIADGHENNVSNLLIRDLLRNKVKGNAQIKYIRIPDQDEWAVNLTDIIMTSAPKRRSRGKIHYEVKAYGRSTTFEWVDTNASRYFPA